MLKGKGHSCLCLVTLPLSWQQLLRNCCSWKKKRKLRSQRAQEIWSHAQADLSKTGTCRKHRYVYHTMGQPSAATPTCKGLLHLLTTDTQTLRECSWLSNEQGSQVKEPELKRAEDGGGETQAARSALKKDLRRPATEQDTGHSLG